MIITDSAIVIVAMECDGGHNSEGCFKVLHFDESYPAEEHLARSRARKAGWSCTGDKDLCPACREEREAGECT